MSEERKPKRIDMRVGMHRKKAPEDLMPKEERAALSRACGAMSDGSKSIGISATERAAIRHMNAAKATSAAMKLGSTGFRIRGEIRGEGRQAAADLGEMALFRMTEAMMGKVSKEKINSVLKASMAVREEVCDPLVKATQLTGALTLEQLVSQAAISAKAKLLKGEG